MVGLGLRNPDLSASARETRDARCGGAPSGPNAEFAATSAGERRRRQAPGLDFTARSRSCSRCGGERGTLQRCGPSRLQSRVRRINSEVAGVGRVRALAAGQKLRALFVFWCRGELGLEREEVSSWQRVFSGSPRLSLELPRPGSVGKPHAGAGRVGGETPALCLPHASRVPPPPRGKPRGA